MCVWRDQDLLQTINTFLKFEKSFDITAIHDSIGNDLDLAQLHLQFMDLSNSVDEIKHQPLNDLLKYISELNRIEFFNEITTVIARICACTPHSADCERIISANYNLKTNKRTSMTISTENQYLYIYFNMVPLEKWDMRPAVDHFLSELNCRQSTRSTANAITTEQRYFKHIFEHTVKDSSNIEDEHHTMHFTF